MRTALACLSLLSIVTSPVGMAAPPKPPEYIIIDTHIDAPYRLYKAPTDLGIRSTEGQFDYPRAMAGGLGTGFMSIFIPADVDAAGNGLPLAFQLIDLVDETVRKNPDKFIQATCPNDVIVARKRGLVGLAMGMENGGPIGANLERVHQLHNRGVSYIGLAHSKPNLLADSSYDTDKKNGGLSQAGRAVVREMNLLGIMVDVSHLSDDAFWNVLSESSTPVIASHSSMRHFIPGFERNMDDRMVAAIVKQGGVVQINVGSGFLTPAARQYETGLMTAVKAEVAARGLAPDSPDIKAFITSYRTQNPYPYATIDDVIDHIDHVVKIGGINGVGIGSDFDGVGDTLPTGLKSVADYPNLIKGLRERGYSKRAVRKIMGENLLRTWRTVERYASKHGTRPRCTL